LGDLATTILQYNGSSPVAAEQFGVHGHGGELGDEHPQRADFEHHGFAHARFDACVTAIRDALIKAFYELRAFLTNGGKLEVAQ
jgi:hypothetical protein